MDNKTTNIKERILYLIDIKGYTKEIFFKNLGVSYGNFKGENKKRPLNSNTLADILAIIPDVNAEWLLTGNGEILKSDANIAAETGVIYTSSIPKEQQLINKEFGDKLDELQKEIKRISK